MSLSVVQQKRKISGNDYLNESNFQNSVSVQSSYSKRQRLGIERHFYVIEDNINQNNVLDIYQNSNSVNNVEVKEDIEDDDIEVIFDNITMNHVKSEKSVMSDKAPCVYSQLKVNKVPSEKQELNRNCSGLYKSKESALHAEGNDNPNYQETLLNYTHPNAAKDLLSNIVIKEEVLEEFRSEIMREDNYQEHEKINLAFGNVKVKSEPKEGQINMNTNVKSEPEEGGINMNIKVKSEPIDDEVLASVKVKSEPRESIMDNNLLSTNSHLKLCKKLLPNHTVEDDKCNQKNYLPLTVSKPFDTPSYCHDSSMFLKNEGLKDSSKKKVCLAVPMSFCKTQNKEYVTEVLHDMLKSKLGKNAKISDVFVLKKETEVVKTESKYSRRTKFGIKSIYKESANCIPLKNVTGSVFPKNISDICTKITPSKCVSESSQNFAVPQEKPIPACKLITSESFSPLDSPVTKINYRNLLSNKRTLLPRPTETNTLLNPYCPDLTIKSSNNPYSNNSIIVVPVNNLKPASNSVTNNTAIIHKHNNLKSIESSVISNSNILLIPKPDLSFVPNKSPKLSSSFQNVNNPITIMSDGSLICSQQNSLYLNKGPNNLILDQNKNSFVIVAPVTSTIPNSTYNNILITPSPKLMMQQNNTVMPPNVIRNIPSTVKTESSFINCQSPDTIQKQVVIL